MDDPESAAYLAQARERIRRTRSRQAAWFILVLWAPVALLIAVVKLLEPHDYPAGDLRNEPAFWVGVALVTVLFVVVMVVLAVRQLRQTNDT